MRDKNISLYFANVSYVRTNKLDNEKIDESFNKLKSDLQEIAPFLDEKHQLVLDRSLFFNSDLHLNSEGRKIRTKILADAILQFKNSKPLGEI